MMLRREAAALLASNPRAFFDTFGIDDWDVLEALEAHHLIALEDEDDGEEEEEEDGWPYSDKDPPF